MVIDKHALEISTNKNFKKSVQIPMSDYFLIMADSEGILTDKSTKQRGGYQKGYKLKTNADGFREFTINVTDEVRELTGNTSNTYGEYESKKPIESVLKAYTDICREARAREEEGLRQGDCPQLRLELLDKLNNGPDGNPKMLVYYLKKTPLDPDRDVEWWRTSGNEYEFDWIAEVLPVKGDDGSPREAKERKQKRSQVAKERWSKLDEIPLRYDPDEPFEVGRVKYPISDASSKKARAESKRKVPRN
jgi:hypothetical protein